MMLAEWPPTAVTARLLRALGVRVVCAQDQPPPHESLPQIGAARGTPVLKHQREVFDGTVQRKRSSRPEAPFLLPAPRSEPAPSTTVASHYGGGREGRRAAPGRRPTRRRA